MKREKEDARMRQEEEQEGKKRKGHAALFMLRTVQNSPRAGQKEDGVAAGKKDNCNLMMIADIWIDYCYSRGGRQVSEAVES
jgi:hypothetical protein